LLLPVSGKTHIVKAVAHRAKCTLFSVKASDIGSKWTGQSEKKVTLLFEEAQKKDYSLIFIDELDCICSNRDSSPDEHGKKVLTSFLTEINRIGDDINNVAVLAATNKPWDLDRAVQDRFVKKIYVPLPDLETRKSILQLQMSEHEHSLNDTDFQRLAQLTEGATAREVGSLAEEACIGSMKCDTYAKVDGKYMPVSGCNGCPKYVEGSEAKCLHCSAVRICPYDVPDGSLKCRSVRKDDFDKNLKPSYCSVTDEMKERYKGWHQT
jgi:SpoVK/Ycf46/Vps4 family AAA+-type ATPase